jgi:hypothetical protein
MWKFIAGYVLGIVVVLGVVYVMDGPVKAHAGPTETWYAITVVATAAQHGYLVADVSFATKAECDAWTDSQAYYDALAAAMTDLVKTYPGLKILSAECVLEELDGEPA